MVHDASQQFIAEAEAELTRIRSGVLVHLQERGSVSELEVPLHKIDVLRSAAVESGQADVAALLKVVADLLQAHISTRVALSDANARSILDLLARIEARLLDSHLDGDDFVHELDILIDSTFDEFESPPVLESNVPSTPAENDRPDVDEELLEIFAAEADELLTKIESSLRILENDPHAREALWEIRRSAHTFKGAAGIVGLMRASGLAHRVEDLLDTLANRDAPANVEMFRLLNDATAFLRAECKGNNAAGSESALAGLYHGFDSIVISDAKSTAPAAAAPDDSVADSAAAPRPARQKQKSVVRVSLDRLDEIMETIHELAATCDKIENSASTAPPAPPAIDPFAVAPPAFLSGALDAAVAPASQPSTPSPVKPNVLLQNQRRLIEELELQLSRIRMVEFGTLSSRINRTVRVTCEEENKRAEVHLQNEHIEIDTQILDVLIEPLLHLLRNAVVHGIESPEIRRLLGKSEKGTISLNVSCDETHIELTVTDDGRGIALAPLREKAIQHRRITREESAAMTDAESLELIFLPGLTTAEKLSMNAGRGVGMSIVRESIESRSGTLSVDTEPQKGTTFTIRLPLTISAAAVRPDELPLPESDLPLTALVVDDSAIVRHATSGILTEAGYNVTEAKDGLDALEVLENGLIDPDVILTDIDMPKVDGYELLSTIKGDRRFTDIPVIVVTSRSDAKHKQRAVDLGAARFIPKPANADKLLDDIARILNKRPRRT